MTTLREGNLQITFPKGAKVRRFDDRASHGLSHCMKAVDFIVEEVNRISFIELKDPDHPNAKQMNRNIFIKDFLSGALDEDLKYKYRDTFLYQWASGSVGKPIYYWIIIALEKLTEAELSSRTDDLRRKLPLKGPTGKWKRPIVTDCMVFNIDTWKRHQSRFPLSRIP